MDYIVFDMEWNQPFSREQTVRTPVLLVGEVIQIGAVKLDEGFHELDTFKINVRPVHYTRMQWSVRKLTGIDNKALRAGVSFPEAYEAFARWCGDDPVFLTWGYDDVPMLQSNARLHGLDPSLTGKWYNLQTIFDRQIAHEGRQCALSRALELVGADFEEEAAHDARGDASATAALCRRLDMKKGLAEYTPTFVNVLYKANMGNFRTPDAALTSPPDVTFPCPICREKHTVPGSCFVRVGKYKLGSLFSCGESEFFLRIAAERRRSGSLRRVFTVQYANDEYRGQIAAAEHEGEANDSENEKASV
ncbi:MAG: exonuclease domain-containing protein [Eubacteriales bacterium]|nr:exonuclease domain-containing protein [Eubacteriales bacterium]